MWFFSTPYAAVYINKKGWKGRWKRGEVTCLLLIKQIPGCVRKRRSISQIFHQFHIRPTTLPLNIKCPQLFIMLINVEAEFSYNQSCILALDHKMWTTPHCAVALGVSEHKTVLILCLSGSSLYIKYVLQKFHHMGNVWSMNYNCKLLLSIEAAWGLLLKTSLTAYSFSFKTRTLNCFADDT